MKKILSVMMALVLLLSLGAVAMADESLTKVQEAGKFVLGLDENFPPMGYRDENGEIVGFDIDVATEVTSRMGVELVLQPIDWSTKELELDSGSIDCIWNGLTITPARVEAMRISKPYLNNKQVVAVRSDDEAQALTDLAGRVVAVQAGSSAADAVEANAEWKATLGEVAEFDDYMMAMMDLEQGGVDAVVLDIIVANYYLAQKGATYRLLDEEVASEEFGIAFRKDDEALCTAVEDALQSMVDDGKLAEISTTWFGEDITTFGQAQ